MAENSWHWGGTAVGDAGAYDNDTDWSDIIRKMFTSDRTVEGVVAGFVNELEVTNPAGQTIRVATGMAIVDGKWYESTANEDTLLAAPGAGTDYYSKVLRKVFAAQTVRQTLVGPVNGGPAPAPTQVDGVTWDLPLAEVRITNGGVVTVIDERDYAWFETKKAQRFFVPAVGGQDEIGGTPIEVYQWGWRMPPSGGDYAGYGFFIVPDDFESSMVVQAVLAGVANTANIRFESLAQYGQCGEDESTHADPWGPTTIGVTASQFNCLADIPLSSAAIGDLVRMRSVRDSDHAGDVNIGNVHLMGWIVTYMAKQL